MLAFHNIAFKVDNHHVFYTGGIVMLPGGSYGHQLSSFDVSEAHTHIPRRAHNKTSLRHTLCRFQHYLLFRIPHISPIPSNENIKKSQSYNETFFDIITHLTYHELS